MITSRDNPRVKDMRRLKRCKDGDRALLEGPHLIAEAAAAGFVLQDVLASPDFLEGDTAREILPLLSRPPLAVAPQLLAEIADSDSPRGIVAAVRLPRFGAGELPLADNGVYVYAEGLQDPGNLGALARVTEASGAVALCLAPGSVSPNHPRALRASAGSLLRLPIAVSAAADDVAERLAPLSPTWIALVPRGGQDLFTAPLAGALILALGAEGPGLSEALLRRTTLQLTIPLAPPVESLNATVAAAIVLFELRRRRAETSSAPTRQG